MGRRRTRQQSDLRTERLKQLERQLERQVKRAKAAYLKSARMGCRDDGQHNLRGSFQGGGRIKGRARKRLISLWYFLHREFHFHDGAFRQ
jgi:hypothetical protein